MKYRYRKAPGGRSEHTEIAERALGRHLPAGAEVHHADGDHRNNAPSNLVVCPDTGYHKLLHKRMKAREMYGNPDMRACWICKEPGLPSDFVHGRNMHGKCHSRYVAAHK